MSERGTFTEALAEFAAASAYSGPCTHCGHLPDEHGENYACARWDRGGDRYTPGTPIPPGSIT